MSGSKLAVSVIIVIIISLGGLLGFYFYLNRATPLEQAPLEKPKTTFSGFDQVSLGNQKNNSNNNFISEDSGTSTATTTPTAQDFDPEDRLRLISAQPIAGGDFIVRSLPNNSTSTKKKVETSEFIRFILKSNGNVFETGTSSTSTTQRLINKTIPKLQEAFFNAKGDGVLIRNIIGDDAIQTRLLSLKPDTENPTSTIQLVTTTDLPLNITTVSMSPDRSKLFYTRNSGNRGTIANLDGSAKTNSFDSPFREWLPQWATPSTIFMNTKPTYLAPGYLYAVDVKTSTVKKVLGDITGLTTLVSNDGQNLLFSRTSNSRLELSLYNFKENSERVLPAATLPEKCAWGNKNTKVIYCAVPRKVSDNGAFPDDWYMGLAHFSDVLWKMNLETGENKMVVDPMLQVGLSLDVMNIKVNKDDNYLVFEDKNTLSFWGIRINKPIPVVTKMATSTATSTKK